MEIPFIGPSYNLDSRESGVQRTINLIPHPQEPGNERTAWVFKDVPGLVLVQDFEEDPDVLVVAFINSPNRAWDGTKYAPLDFTTARPLTSSTYASYSAGNGNISISQAGAYEVTIAWHLVSGKFASDACSVGTEIAAVNYSEFEVYPDQSYGRMESLIAAPALVTAADQCGGVHRHILNVYAAPITFEPRIYGEAYTSTPEFSAYMAVTVRRSGSSIYTPP